jgi:alanine racemase
MYLSAVRVGTLLSGQHPVGNFPIRLQLQDPYKFKSRITSLRTLEKGSYLGYYRTFQLHRTTQIAVLPVGFNDGLALEVGNPPAGWSDMLRKLAKIFLGFVNWPRVNLKVRIQDRNCPIRGKVFMQMALVEIPPGLKVKVGDEVELPVRKTVASASITRIYIKADKHYEG